MPGSVYHQLTATTPDDPAYEIRPSHFNQSHLVTINATGSEISNAFSNANGLSFGLSAGAITGSYTVPSIPSVTEYFSKTNTTFNGANISGSITNNTNGLQLSLSVAPAGGGADGYNIIAAGTQTAATTGTIVFSNSNGITFGMSNSSIVTASHNGLTTAMASNRGSDFVQATAAFAGTSASGTIASNGISVSIGPYITTAMLSNAATISNIRVSAGTTSNLLSAFTFNDANGLSFGLNASTITGSYSRPVVSNAIASVGSATNSGTNTSRFAADDHIHAGVFSMGVSTGGNTSGDTRVDVGRFVLQGGNNITLSQVTAANALNTIVVSAGAGGGVNPVASASNGSFSFTTLGFSNANNVTFGTSAGSIITASVAAPGAAAENNWFNLLGANTSGNTTASGSTIGLSGINITISGTNGSVINISGPSPVTQSGYDPYAYINFVQLPNSQGTLSINPIDLPNVQFDRCGLLLIHSNATNSSGSHSLSFRVGVYTRNASTLSLVTSQSTSFAVTLSGTVGSYSLYSGLRLVTMGLTTTLTAGRYWIAVNSNSTSGGANASYSLAGASNMNTAFVGFFNASHNTTYQASLGLGLYTASTTSMPGSIAFTQIQGSNSVVWRAPIVKLFSSTI